MTTPKGPDALRRQPTPPYKDSGLPLGTEVYGFLEALDVTWSTFEVEALEQFIRGRIDAALASPPPCPSDIDGDPCACLCHVEVLQTACLHADCDVPKRLALASPQEHDDVSVLRASVPSDAGERQDLRASNETAPRIQFRHWSKDALVPYDGCSCATCVPDMKGSER